MTKVLGHLVQRAALVEEKRGARVAEVVAPEVGDTRLLECWDPDASTPVPPAEVAALAVREDERARVRTDPVVGSSPIARFNAVRSGGAHHWSC